MNEQLSQGPESIFFDRHEAYFQRYVQALGLATDAEDWEIATAMQNDMKMRGPEDRRPLSIVVAAGEVTSFTTSIDWVE